MELKRDGTVVVHAPLRLGVEKIDAFVAAHEAWLARARTRQAERIAAHPEPTEAAPCAREVRAAAARGALEPRDRPCADRREDHRRENALREL